MSDAKVSPSDGGSLFGSITGQQWLGAASSVLGSALGGSSAPANSSAYSNSSVDGSGWTIATGNARASAGFELPWYLYLVAAYVAVVWLEKK